MQVNRTSLPAILKLLAHEVRWNLLQLLTESDYRVQDLVKLLEVPQNLVSYHLRLLREGEVVKERRSSADERSSYYSVDLDRLHMLYQSAIVGIHASLAEGLPREQVQQEASKKRAVLRVLFLCTENSSRSQMAEALLRQHSHGTIDVCSAGSLPVEEIHPLAVALMTRLGIDMQQQYPKYLEAFRGEYFDYVITVCDQLRETCPTFPGDPKRIHWSFADPAFVEGTEDERSRAFEQTVLQLSKRIRLFLTLLRYQKGYEV